MEKTLVSVGIAAVAIAGVWAFSALQEHKHTHGTQENAVSTAHVVQKAGPASAQLCDFTVPSVAAQAKAIAESVHATATDRDTRIATATRNWVVSHVVFRSQSQLVPADVTLQTRQGNDASMSVLIAALLRSDGIPAVVELVPAPTPDGNYGDSMPMRYVVMAGNTRGVELDTPYQHRQPQPLTATGTMPW